jgi:Phytanoyl-CoA dioxygenase (PhyH)
MIAQLAAAGPDATLAHSLARELEAHGIVRLPSLVSDETLRDMRLAFGSRLRRMRFNDCDGYERTERYRLMVQDVLTLAQGFVDVALHPLVKAVLGEYLGDNYALCEAKGWRSLPTMHDFHGWHGDAWYDQTKVAGRIPREVKLGLYLSDVTSGAFQYLKGTHGKQAPRHLSRGEAADLPLDRMVETLGPAGSAFLFDTSGIHRQGIPILEPREAVFLNYHDPAVPLQAEDVEYYRYHPLLLNAALLGNLAAEDARILGFGDKTHYQPNFARRSPYPGLHAAVQELHAVRLIAGAWCGRVADKLRRMLRRK